MPVEEAEELAKLCAGAGFKLVQLVTPTTPRERAQRIARLATGFLYCVSVVGITGERAQIPPQLLDQLPGHFLQKPRRHRAFRGTAAELAPELRVTLG